MFPPAARPWITSDLPSAHRLHWQANYVAPLTPPNYPPHATSVTAPTPPQASYATLGRLSTVSAPGDDSSNPPVKRTLTFHYVTNPTNSPLIHHVTDDTSRTVTFGYNATGDLTSVRDVGQQSGNASQHSTTMG